jgi:DNA invertase Pin-like site-specific DNA recombinase
MASKRSRRRRAACPAGSGIHFRTVEDGLDTRGSTGKLVLHMLGAVAQFERDLIIERTRAGLAAARKRGRRLGPPVRWQADMARKAQTLMDKGHLNAEEVVALFPRNQVFDERSNR